MLIWRLELDKHSIMNAYQRFREFGGSQPDSMASVVPTLSTVSREKDPVDDCDFPDAILGYITKILMEDDVDEQTCMLQESLAFQAAEKSLYDTIGKKYPPSPEQISTNYYRNGLFSPEDDLGGSDPDYASSFYIDDRVLADGRWLANLGEPYTSHDLPCGIPHSSNSSSGSLIAGHDWLLDSPDSTLQSAWQFRKGVTEASKLLPQQQGLRFNFEFARAELQEHEMGNCVLVTKNEMCVPPAGLKGKRTSARDDTDTDRDAGEERSSKLPAIFEDAPLRSEMLDKVLLTFPGQDNNYYAYLHGTLQNEQPKGSKVGRGRGRKRKGKKEIVDLRTLMINCAHSIAAGDHRIANETLRQIKLHSSPFGDANQRLAHCFADALEARLAGSQIYKALVSKRISVAEILKAYRSYIAACPFRKVSNVIASKSIADIARNRTTIHVIDFGILYGFQWPTFIQRLSILDGGTPKLRITGIEFPHPGFRPIERVEETGRRLAAYAEEFGVPFEYNAIAKKWEDITIEELNIRSDEFVAVNCLYRAQNLFDETVATDSPRDVVLSLIRRVSPDIFIHGILNGGYNAPFFFTRFREALFHFSAMFDMLDTVLPREDQERLVLEKEIFGREALNVIACESWGRVERPDTYKQWHVRLHRAGFKQVPFERNVVNRAITLVNSFYHKDFVIDEGNQWLLQGWKGRIIYALSAWKPA